MKVRLAGKDKGYGGGISVRRSTDFGTSSLHGHDFYELDIIVGGEQCSPLNGNPTVAQRGTVYFLSPEDFHEYLGDGRVDILNVQFFGDAVSGDILRRLMDRKSRIYLPAERSFSTVCRLFSAIEDSLSVGEGTTAICTRLLEAILLILLSEVKDEGGVTATPVSDMQRALIYIHEHFKENPGLSEVADILPLDRRYFCTKFKEYTGKSYKEYLRERKLRYARRLILATSMPLISIANESGYATQSHFNREFREHYGVSPTEMRKSSGRKN